MSNLPEIKRRLDHLKKLGNGMKEQMTALKGPVGEGLKKDAKKQGTKIGIGAGLSFFGMLLATVACLYVLAVIILAVNVALDRPWLSALIVVGGFLLIGGIVIAIGAGIAGSSAKKLSKATGDLTGQLKKSGEEMKKEIEELQNLAKKEAEERQKMIVERAKTVAPIAAGAGLVCMILKKKMKSRKLKRAVMKVVELYEEASSE